MTRRTATTWIPAALLALACGDPAPAPEPPAAAAPSEPAAAEAPAKPDAAAVEAPAKPDAAAVQAQASKIFGTLPTEVPNPENELSEARIALGRVLYFDPRLSKGQDISCNSCHDLARFGVDGEPTSPGHKGQRGGRNSPSVYNAAFHVAQFWDGRSPDVEDQAKGPVLNPIEMAMPSEEAVVVLLKSVPGYQPLFEAAYPGESDPITYDNMARAIGAFERRLLTPGRFDAFLGGDLAALNESEVEGLATFVEVGCITCHMGPGVGGSSFQKLGLVKPYPDDDAGRFEVTGKEADRQVFKVPSLRNVAQTGPWFHDGSITELDRAIRLMGEHQLGHDLSDDEVAAIGAFLTSLTGDVDAAYTAKPELPPSGPETPGPDLS